MNRAAEPYLKVSQAVNGFAASRVLHVAVELDLFTSLTEDGKTAAQLSRLLGVHPGAIELLLNALTSMGFLRKEAERFFATPVSHTYLSRFGPKYLGHWIRHEAHGWERWSRLRDAIRTGKPVQPAEQIYQTPAELEEFIRGMHELALARGDARWLARAISLVRCRTLLDLGGGPGTYASLFCRANPQLEATVVDLPETLKVTRKILREFDLSGRVRVLEADYRRDRIQGGPYDVALLSNILHAETEATNRQLLANIFEVLSPGGALIIKDHVMSADHTEPANGALFALEMLLSTRGRTYSFGEIAAWLAAAGFHDTSELPMESPSNVSLVLATRPGKPALVVLPRPAAKLDVANPAEPRAESPQHASRGPEASDPSHSPVRTSAATQQRQKPPAPRRKNTAPAPAAARRRSSQSRSRRTPTSSARSRRPSSSR